MRIILLAWFLCGLLGPGLLARAQGSAARPPTGASLEGLWSGELTVPGGDLELSISIIRLTGGKYFGALDVPMQRLNRVAVEVRQPAGSDSVVLLVPDSNSRFLGRRSADGQQLSGMWCRMTLRTPMVLHYALLSSSLDPDPRFALPYHTEEVVFTNFTSKLRLAGTLTLPTGTGPFPAVVLVSDMGKQDRDGLAPGAPATLVSYRLLGSLADYLTRRGFVVLRCDDRGVGQSGGSSEAATPVQRAGDVQAALNFLRTRPEADLLHLGVVGHGEGANLALLAAAQPLAPAFVVGLGAYGLPGYETLLHQQVLAWQAQKLPPAQLDLRLRRQRTLYDLIRYSTNQPQTLAIVANLLRQGEATLAAPAAQQQATALLTPWYRAFLAFDPLDNLRAVQCPVLLISGQADEQAPPDQHLAALAHELHASGNRAVTALRPAGVNHLLQPPTVQWTMLNGEMKPTFSPLVQEQLAQWLAAQATR